jgi:hypothetical protein
VNALFEFGRQEGLDDREHERHVPKEERE